MWADRLLPWRSAQVVAQIVTRLLFDVKVEGRQHLPASGAC